VLHDGELFGRIVAAALLGGLVGWERYVRGQQAGDRTFALVAAGAAAFTALGVDAFPNTAEKVIAGIVTGIGFIGGGLLLRSEGAMVRGSPPPLRSGRWPRWPGAPAPATWCWRSASRR
jgi:putative Mg2+ transporter-C (MgtC) family protein